MKKIKSIPSKLVPVGSARTNIKGQVTGNTNEPLIGGLYFAG